MQVTLEVIAIKERKNLQRAAGWSEKVETAFERIAVLKVVWAFAKIVEKFTRKIKLKSRDDTRTKEVTHIGVRPWMDELKVEIGAVGEGEKKKLSRFTVCVQISNVMGWFQINRGTHWCHYFPVPLASNGNGWKRGFLEREEWSVRKYGDEKIMPHIRKYRDYEWWKRSEAYARDDEKMRRLDRENVKKATETIQAAENYIRIRDLDCDGKKYARVDGYSFGEKWTEVRAHDVEPFLLR